MSYLVFCTFDLKNASSQDYKTAYAELDKLGLKKVVKSNGGGEVVIPSTSTMGTFNGTSAGSVRDDMSARVQNAFRAKNLSSEIFLVVGGDWAWGAKTT